MSGSIGSEVDSGSRPGHRPGRRADVSIIVPCYNAADTVGDTVSSIQAQTHQDWEAICVDDGSTDRTPQLLEALAGSDPRIRWTRGPNRSPAAARNDGLSLAQADRVLFLDADDVARPEAVAMLLEASRAVGENVIVSAGYELLDPAGEPLGIYHFPSVPDFTVDAFLGGNRLPPMTLVPSSVLGARPFDEDERKRGCEDWDLWLRLAHAGVGCVTVPGVLFGYRLCAGSLSHNADRMYAAARRVLECWLPLARDPEAAGQATLRLACGYGAVALAAGSENAIWRYFQDSPTIEPTEDFYLAAAHGIAHAFEFVHGAAGLTWADNTADWLAVIETWLEDGPLAVQAGSILERLRRVVIGPQDRLAAVHRFLSGRGDTRRLVVYGLGTNGATLLQQLRGHPGLAEVELWVADDHADPLMLATLGLPGDDPRRWTCWPPGTVVVITPHDCRAMRQTLASAAGREGTDFIALAEYIDTAAVPAG